MKKSKIREEQIVTILGEAEETKVVASVRKHGASEQTVRRWRKQYARMEVSDVRPLRRQKDENARLMKLLAAQDFGIKAMEELQVKSVSSPGSVSDAAICYRSRLDLETRSLAVFYNSL